MMEMRRLERGTGGKNPPGIRPESRRPAAEEDIRNLHINPNNDVSLNVFNIQRFSVYDGPGVRTVVFCKGCNLRCLWCHNPESYDSGRQLEFNPEKCIGCGACFQNCPHGAHVLDENGVHQIDREACQKCFACVRGCYAEALRCVGQTLSGEEVAQAVLDDNPYYEGARGGGVTFSGGECMLQANALVPILRRLKDEGVHTALDTAGHVPYAAFEKVLPFTDLLLYDLKAMDSAVHRRLTGVDNGLILRNFEKLCESGVPVVVRIPCIPGCNDGEIPALGAYLRDKNIVRAEVMGYHAMGESKFAFLGQAYSLGGTKPPDDHAMDSVLEALRSFGVNAVRS